MKSGAAAKKARGMYMKDENPSMRVVVAALKKGAKKFAPGTKHTVLGARGRIWGM